MVMTKTFITAALAIMSLTAASVGAPAQAASGDAQLIQVQGGGCFSGERPGDCSERMRVEQSNHRHYVWRDGHYEDATGAVVAGSILGFVLGAAIAGVPDDRVYYERHHEDRDWRAHCESAYPGFDYGTGTYLGPDGYRHYCTR
jgi:hypothetical protein